MEDHQARVLRTMRAWLGVDQAVAAKEMGLGVATLRRAETGLSGILCGRPVTVIR